MRRRGAVRRTTPSCRQDAASGRYQASISTSAPDSASTRAMGIADP
jgi:hypothetical protein